ncbi:MAG: MarR family transcriptional regulator [Chloroflexi bacterium]|nr:MarR family transcriptional regulator [Chloroflexota bacterium]
MSKSQALPSDIQISREHLLKQAVDILAEVTSSGPYTISPEWLTLDLSTPQIRALFLILQEGSLRMSRLASALDVSVSRATGLVDRLVEKDLVSRWPDPDDRRSVLCALTEKGKELAQRLSAARRSRWEERLAPLSQAELKKVCKAMELVRSAIRRGTPAPESLTVDTVRR